MGNGGGERKYSNDGNCRDLTGFWLAWRETCSIRKCLDSRVLERDCAAAVEAAGNVGELLDQACYVRDVSNRAMAKCVSRPMKLKDLKWASGGVRDGGAQVDGGVADGDEFEEEAIAEGDQRIDYGERRAEGNAAYCNPKGFGAVEEDPDEATEPQNGGWSGKANLPRGVAVSEYIDMVYAWRTGNPGDGTTMAFELIEEDFYVSEKRDAESGEPLLKGKKWKDYLFEDIATRSGGMNRNLWGYLLRNGEWNRNGCCLSRLQKVAKSSFRWSEKVLGETDGAAEKPDDNQETASEGVQNGEALSLLRERLEELWADRFDRADRVAVCGIFGTPALDEEAARIAGVKLTALYRRRDKWRRCIFVDFLGDECGVGCDEMRWLVKEGGYWPVRKLATEGETRDGACVKFYAHQDKKELARLRKND